MVRTWCFRSGAQVQSLVEELRSRKPCGIAKIKKNKNNKVRKYSSGEGRLETLSLRASFRSTFSLLE